MNDSSQEFGKSLPELKGKQFTIKKADIDPVQSSASQKQKLQDDPIEGIKTAKAGGFEEESYSNSRADPNYQARSQDLLDAQAPNSIWRTELDESQQKEIIHQFERLGRAGDTQSRKQFDEFDLHGQLGGGGQYLDGLSEDSAKDLSVRRLWCIIRDRLFRVNYVLLHHRACSYPVYHIVMLFEFFQLAFLTYYGYYIFNGFATLEEQTIKVDKYLPKLIQSRAADIQNVTQEILNLMLVLQRAQPVAEDDTSWRMDEKLKFANPSLYVLGPGKLGNYLGFFWSFVCLFYGLIFGLILFGGSLYHQLINTQAVTSQTKLGIKLLALATLLFNTAFQLPFLTLLLQAFNCSENNIIPYSIPEFECGGSERQLVLPFSIVTIMIYGVFFFTENVLMERTQFGSKYPWAGTDRGTNLIRFGAKFSLLCGFVFDKQAQFKVEFMVTALALLIVSLYRRFNACNYYNRGVNFLHTLYDVLLSVHLLFISSHIMARARYQIPITVLFVIIAVFLHQLYYRGFLIRIDRAINGHNFLHQSSLESAQMHLQFIFDRLDNGSQTDQLYFFGHLSSHMETCNLYQCRCFALSQKLTNLNVFGRFVTQRKQREVSVEDDTISNNSRVKSRILATEQDRSGPIIHVHRQLNASEVLVMDVEGTGQRASQEVISRSFNELAPEPSNVDLERSDSNMMVQTKQASEGEKALQLYEEVFGHPLEHELDPNSPLFSMDDSLLEKQRIRRLSFKYLAILIHRMILRFPAKACFRLHLANLYKYQLGKQFKAIYELVGCQTLPNNTVAEQFLIFQLMGQIEQELQYAHARYIEKSTQLDVLKVHDYNRAFLDFQKNEFLATLSALKFWRELQQKEFNANNLQSYGHQISRCLGRIQDAEREIEVLKPTDMKFYFRYGMFLINIINNEQDGLDCLQKMQTTYTMSVDKKVDKINETNIFSTSQDNQCIAFILISTEADNFCSIIHANDEVEALFGYKRKHLLDQNVRILMPKVIGHYHDHFVGEYLARGKVDWKDSIKKSFGQTIDGFVFRADIIIKLYPRINGEIKLVGMVGRSAQNQSSSSTANNQNASLSPIDPSSHVLITDRKGYISNISVGLVSLLGLHPKLFKYSMDSFLSMIRIDAIAPSILDQEAQEQMEQEGAYVAFDSTNILTILETEMLLHEDIDVIRLNLKRVDLFVKTSKMPLYDGEFAIIYSIHEVNHSNSAVQVSTQKGLQLLRSVTTGSIGMGSSSKNDMNHESGSRTHNMSSVSSSTGSGNSFNTLVRDFKKTLMDRRMPRALIILNWLITLVLIGTITLTALFYMQVKTGDERLEKSAMTSLAVDRRNMGQTEVAINMNTYIGIANNLIANRFPLDTLNQIIDRSVLLLSLILSYQDDTQANHNVILKLKNGITTSERKNGYEVIYSAFEQQLIDTLIVDEKNTIINYKQIFQHALQNYLTETSMQGYKTVSDLWLPEDYITTPIAANPYQPLNDSTIAEKSAYFLYANGLRSIRRVTELSTEFFHKIILDTDHQKNFFTILMVSIMVVVASIALIFYQIWQTEHIQSDIFSLYAYLSQTHITDTYNKAQDYLVSIVNGSFIGQIAPAGFQQEGLMQSLNVRVGLQELKKSKGRENLSIYSMMVRRAFQQARELYQPKEPAQESPNDPNPHDSNPEGDGMQQIFNGQRMVSKKFVKMNQRYMSKLGTIAKDAKPKLQQNPKGRQSVLDLENEEEKVEGKHKGSHKKHHKHDESEDSHSESQEQSRQLEKVPHQQDPVRHHLNEAMSQSLSEVGRIEQRKAQFKKTYHNSDTKRKFGVFAIAVAVLSYFIVAYLLQGSEDESMDYLMNLVPIFFDRCRLVHLACAFVRERIFANNTMDSFEYDPIYERDIDIKYNDLHIENEKVLVGLQNGYRGIAKPMIELLEVLDSPSYCDTVIQNQVTETQDLLDASKSVWTQAQSTEEYTSIIKTVHRACEYARFGNLKALKKLKNDYGVNFDYGDYDYVAPLHHAVRAYQLDVVNYLIKDEQVRVNHKDRWGFTALDYVQPGSSLESTLAAQGGLRTIRNGSYVKLTPAKGGLSNLTEQQARLFYACFFGDLQTVRILNAVGLDLNIKDSDGRTPLQIAAAEGNYNVVVYLVALGVNVQSVDSRGNDARFDAKNSAVQSSYDLINSVISSTIIKDYCKQFSNAIFKNGMATAMGAYHKKFLDLLILVNSTNSYVRRTTLIYGERFNPSKVLKPSEIFTQRDIPLFMTGCELYFNSVINSVTQRILYTYDQYLSQYRLITLAMFIVYLAVQLLAVLVLRKQMIGLMREDIFKSRGILNLIPNSFFEQNKNIVEGIMQKLKF